MSHVKKVWVADCIRIVLFISAHPTLKVKSGNDWLFVFSRAALCRPCLKIIAHFVQLK